MRTFFDCIPCFIGQSLDSVRMITPDRTIHEQLLGEILQVLGELDFRQSPPAIAQRSHRLIRELTGKRDPYRATKDRFNRLALDIYTELKRRIKRSTDPLATAARLAIAGNVIDLAVNNHLGDDEVREAIDHAAEVQLDGDVATFTETTSIATSVLYLADNAGEVVFDRLLIEQIPWKKVTVAVKGSPVINDATIEDAEAVRLLEPVEVIDSGSDGPGTILDDCSQAFRRCFDEVDLVIAKGQGNYETPSDVNIDVFFHSEGQAPRNGQGSGLSGRQPDLAAVHNDSDGRW